MNTITTEVIENSDLIEDACALLYESYVVQGRWKFSENNPSEIRVETKNGRKLLVDKFTYKARWWGVFDENKLIGCGRLTGLDVTGKYEVEGYEASQVVHEFIPRSNCFEMGKVAVSKDYKGKRIINLIYLVVFEYCQRNKFSVFGCLSNAYIKSLFQRVKFYPRIEQAFRYEETDPTPVSFYLIDYQKSEFDPIVENLRKSIVHSENQNLFSVLDALEIVAPILPVPVYWHDREGHVLGINELCLKGMGTTAENVIGKTPYDFYPKETADHIIGHHELVMQTEEILSQEEFINNISTGKPVYAKAVKVPLYDDNGNVTGIIGTSIDITAEKQAEKLKLELQAQEKITTFARKVAHDINSPITALKIWINGCAGIPPENLRVLNNTIDRLHGISRNLLDIREDNSLVQNTEQQKCLAIYDLVSEIANEKRIEHQNKSISFKLRADMNTKSAAIKIQPGQFKRALSNLINNAVEALCDSRDGIITIDLLTDANLVIFDLHDNGKGMPQTAIEKILNRQGFSEGKPDGHGLGLQQVWDMLTFNNGKIDIRSTLGEGTKVRISFPKVSHTQFNL